MRRIRAILPIIFLLVATACGQQKDEDFESFTFTPDDAAEISALLDQIEQGQGASGATTPAIVHEGTGAVQAPQGGDVLIDVSNNTQFDAIRSGAGTSEGNLFRVTNAFLNVRATANLRGDKVEELTKGDSVHLLSFPDASWAHIELPDGRKGYVSTSYIAQVVTEEKLPEVKKQYEGKYFVDFAFLNVRSTPSGDGQKIGELRANEIVAPLAFHDEWARVPFQGQEGFVSTQYLKPFAPSFVVRQDRFTIPILHYSADERGIADTLVRHLAILRGGGFTAMTLKELYTTLLSQEERDIRISPKTVILTISNLTPEDVKDITDALRASGVHATLFLRTSSIGPEGIPADLVRSIATAGNDIESAGHSSDDFRALTNDQIMSDLMQSRKILEDLTGENVLAASYPNGGVNGRVVEQAMKAGFLFGLTLAPSADGSFSRGQFLELPSFVLSSTTTDAALRDLIGMTE